MKNNQTTIERFNPDVHVGLSSEQVLLRKSQKLDNHVGKKISKSYFSIFVNNIFTFFNLLGLIVAVALVLVKAPISRFFFVLIYFANILIGIIQEIRAKICIDRLSLVTEKRTTVIRNGKAVDINSKFIVLDDILLLDLGNQIPTDCEILDGCVEVNESLLTGESVPVKKSVGQKLFAGSFIVSGKCTTKAICVGKDNYVEKLSEKAKKYKKPYSELMYSLKHIITVIGIIIVPIAVVFLIKSNIIHHTTIIQGINSASTVIIGMIPSGMFLLTSMALAVGVIKLAKRKTLVQDLYSLEMLARVDTLCFDKTGTITDGKMNVKKIEDIEDDQNDFNQVISSILGSTKDNNQTAMALINQFGNTIHFSSSFVLPFNSERKLSAVSFNEIGTYAFGAPEFLLSKTEYKKIEKKIFNYASRGYRVLVFAKSNNLITEQPIPCDFKPFKLIVLADNIRKETISTVKWFKENGVDIKVISGDNPLTVSEVSKQVGIENAEKYISLEGLSDAEVFSIANDYTVFGRVSPEQKAILVKGLQSAGHVCGMTGDGVNDILALKESDCAISVASGSDAARSVANLVLSDNNFNSLPKVVEEGRRVINNVTSSASLYLMKTCFTFFLSLLFLVLPTIEYYPFVNEQMILLEVFIIGMPSFFLSFQPNESRVEGKFMTKVLSRSFGCSFLMLFSVLLVEIFRISFGTFSKETYITMEVIAFSLAGLINLYRICSPINIYRGILFFLNAIFVIIIISYALIKGLPLLGLTKMTPINEYWHHLLIVVSIFLLDIPLSGLFINLAKKIKFKKLLNLGDVKK